MLRHEERADSSLDNFFTEDFGTDYAPEVEDDRDGATTGAAFFGWLISGALAVLMLAIVGATGTALGWDKLRMWAESQADLSTLVVTGLALIVVTVSAYAGGYASGRMVRSHGAQQGFGVWLFWLGSTIAVVLTAYVLNAHYDLWSRAEAITASVPMIDRLASSDGLVALGVVLLAAMLGTVSGGIAGNRYYQDSPHPGATRRP